MEEPEIHSELESQVCDRVYVEEGGEVYDEVYDEEYDEVYSPTAENDCVLATTTMTTTTSAFDETANVSRFSVIGRADLMHLTHRSFSYTMWLITQHTHTNHVAQIFFQMRYP